MKFVGDSAIPLPMIAAAGLLLLGFRAHAGLLPFPLSANQLGTVRCLEDTNISYQVYLPPAYSTNGPPLPILYTFNPGGGGGISYVGAECRQMNIIAVGVTGPANNLGWDIVMSQCDAVTRDIRHRVLFDPTAEFAGGLSGGGLVAYMFSRMRSQHTAGTLEFAGWLGRINDSPTHVTYYSTDRIQTNFFVARTTGNSDSGALFYNPFDSNFLASCGTVIYDQYFSGGHQVPPNNVISNALVWLIGQRIPAGPLDQSNALFQASDWQSRIAGGDRESVLRECMSTLMDQPRSWYALEAELTMDDLMLDCDNFRPLAVDHLSQGDFAYDVFYYLARGSADTANWPRYWSSLKGLAGITGTNGDRTGDIHDLLVQFGYPSPILQGSIGSNPGPFNLQLNEDTPGLDYFAQTNSDLVSGSWQDAPVTAVDSDGVWSAAVDLPPEQDCSFYRLRTAPAPGISPPWPPQ